MTYVDEMGPSESALLSTPHQDLRAFLCWLLISVFPDFHIREGRDENDNHEIMIRLVDSGLN